MKNVVFFISLFVICLFFLPYATFASNHTDEARRTSDLLGLQYGAESGLSDGDIRRTAARVINVALSVLGIIFVSLTVYAGFRWMTAGGNEEGVNAAKKTLYAAVIGLVIILSAYIVTNFILRSASYATQGDRIETNRFEFP